MKLRVADVGNWLCSKIDGQWEIIRFRDEESRIAPEDIKRLRGHPAQIAAQIAECDVEGSKVLLILDGYAELDSADCRALSEAARTRLGDAAIVVATKMSKGHARVDASLCQDAEKLPSAFAAVAVIKARWNWDESKCIRIETDDRVIEVEPTWDGKNWTAEIISTHSKPST